MPQPADATRSVPRERLGTAARTAGLAEVWGDVVDLGDLGRAVVIGAVVSLAFYLVGTRVFALVAKPDVARSYAMLAGLVGCIVGGALCARLFRPKRVVTEDAIATETGFADPGGAVAADDSALPPSVRAEMRQLGLSGVAPSGSVLRSPPT